MKTSPMPDLENFMKNDFYREQSIKILQYVGIEIPTQLPQLENIYLRRNKADIQNRICCLLVCAAVSYGLNRDNAILWLKNENLDVFLEDEERTFIFENVGNPREFQERIEAMWTLSWVVNMIQDFNLFMSCSDSFVNILPNLKILEPSNRFFLCIKIRPIVDLIQNLDTLYCLHWFYVQEQLLGKMHTCNLPQLYVIEQRRRALEWLFSSDSFGTITLDT